MKKLELANLKSKYGSIYFIEIEGYPIYYRTLNAWEIQSFLDLKGSSSKDKIEVEIALCTFSIVNPSKLPEFKAPGSLSLLSTEIWSKSVPSEESITNIIETAREWAELNCKDNYSVMIAISLSRLLPATSLSTLLELPLAKLIRLAALAEISADIKFLKGEGPKEQGKKLQMKENMTPDETASALQVAIKKQRENK